jgi:hypothetical protein
MPGLDPGIHVLRYPKKGVDGRVKPGHDEGESRRARRLLARDTSHRQRVIRNPRNNRGRQRRRELRESLFDDEAQTEPMPQAMNGSGRQSALMVAFGRRTY